MNIANKLLFVYKTYLRFSLEILEVLTEKWIKRIKHMA